MPRAVRIFDMRRSSRTISTMRRPGHVRQHVAARIDGRDRGVARAAPMPSASTMLAMVEAVPMVMQWPAERDMQASASMNSSSVMLPARTSSLIDQTTGARADVLRRETCRSASDRRRRTMVGRSQLAAPIISAGVVLSQPHQQHHAVDRVGADRFLDIHAERGCGTAWRSGASGLAQATSPEIRAGNRRLS